MLEPTGCNATISCFVAGQFLQLLYAEVPWLASVAGVQDALVVVESPGDAEIRRLIGGSSVIVSSSGYEGFGLAAVEGMSAGLFPLLSHIAPFERLVGNAAVGLN